MGPTAILQANRTFSDDSGAGRTSLATTSDMMGWIGFMTAASLRGDSVSSDDASRPRLGAKADAVALRFPGRLVIAADTAVIVDGMILGKPADDVEAERMLRLLSGRVHDVLTAVAAAVDDRRANAVERSAVAFAALSDEAIATYVRTGEPLDKAGGYAIQGLASAFCRLVSGAYDNVVGLPVGCVRRILEELGYSEAEPAPEN